MAEPNLHKRRKILDPIFEDFKKNTERFKNLKASFDLFFGRKDHIMKFRFLEIIGSNAQTNASFSRASCIVQNYQYNYLNSPVEMPRLCSLSNLFSDGRVTLEKYFDDESSLPLETKQEKALKKLLYFFNSGYKDFKPKEDIHIECEWAVQLAQHLLSKLAIGSTFTVEHHYSKDSILSDDEKLLCPCGKKDEIVQGVFGDTSFGCADAWHGSVDILFEGASISVSDLPECCKSSVSSDDDSQSSVEVKTGNKLDEQIFAQCIVFSFLQSKRMPNLNNFLIPSIAFNRDKVRVTFYDCKHDVLLQTPEIGLFRQCKNELNGTAVVFLWLVLNYRYFCSGLTDSMKEYKAKFFERAGDYLSKYKNDVMKPVHKVAKVKDEECWWRFESSINESNPARSSFYELKQEFLTSTNTN